MEKKDVSLSKTSTTVSLTDTETEPTVPAPVGQTESSRKTAATVKDGQTSPSMVDILYDQINNVLGGDNQNQYFCLTFPGTLLNPDSYRYDAATQSKPLTVQANESALTNKLFDACQVTGSDNGRSLPQQYSTALDMLTPKLNPGTVEAKNALRDMLMSPYAYDFGQGLVTDLTLQQVFYRLYDEWVATKQVWAQTQENKKAELAQQYPGTSVEDNQNRQNAYLAWYETVAEGYLERLNEQYSKILAVFSPSDMKILEGVLDSGSGAELQEARETLNNTRRANPNGGYTYPVNLQPNNWFDLLDNSFTGVDLLDSPELLSEKMYMLSNQKAIYSSQIEQIAAAIPSDAEVDAAMAKVTDAKSAVNSAEKDLTDQYGSGIKTVLNAAVEILSVPGGAVTSGVLSRLASKSGLNGDDQGLIDSLNKVLSNVQSAQKAYIEAMGDLTAAQESYIQLHGLEELASLLTPLKANLEQLDLQIQQVADKIALSQQIQSAGGDSTTSPRQVPAGYTALTIQANASSMDTATSKSSSASSSSTGVSFLFGGYTQDSGASQSAYDSFTHSKDCKVEIGMAVAKVSIQRDWFNPGLFTLSGDMCNVTSEKVAPDKAYPGGFDDNRFTAMNDCVFPCFPTAFVVARDVTVKITTSESISQQTSRAMEQHAAKGGGFLFFRGSSSSSSSGSQSGAHVSSSGQSITIRFTDPQVLGYYMEATPGDYSSPIDSADSDYVTVLDFVKKYKAVLTAHAEQKKGV